MQMSNSLSNSLTSSSQSSKPSASISSSIISFSINSKKRKNFSQFFENNERNNSLKKTKLENSFNEENQTLFSKLKEEGNSLAEIGEFEKALAKFNEALLINPKDSILYQLKSQILLELERSFEAIQAAEFVIKLNPSWSEGWKSLARAQVNFGEIKLACESYKKCLELNPNDKEVKENELPWALSISSRSKGERVKVISSSKK